MKQWQHASIEVTNNGATLRNRFGRIHHSLYVLEWFKSDGKWECEWSEDAMTVLTFQAQPAAAAIIKKAMLRVEEQGLGQRLKLQFHDSLSRHHARWDRAACRWGCGGPQSMFPFRDPAESGSAPQTTVLERNHNMLWRGRGAGICPKHHKMWNSYFG